MCVSRFTVEQSETGGSSIEALSANICRRIRAENQIYVEISDLDFEKQLQKFVTTGCA